MKTIRLPDDLHRFAKTQAASKGVTLEKYIADLLDAEQKRQTTPTPTKGKK